MENSQFIKFLIPVLISGFFIFNINYVFAYNIGTHAFLTAEIINFYNKNFPERLIADEFRNYLIDGSRREDDPVRWMNHFYDPVYNRGLTIDFGTFSLKDVASVSFIDLTSLNSSWLSSKDWAQDSNSQNKLKYSPSIATILSSLQSEKIQKYFPTSDFSWQEAIRYWIQGDGEIAMFTLGHVLHLIEDKTVPDHTRNDPHPGDSPYEIYTQQFSLSNLDKNLSGRLKNKQPIILDNLNSYFDEAAMYSNNSFYSKDTVGVQSGYNLPQPDYYQEAADGRTYWMKSDREFGDYYLAAAPPKLIWFTLNSQELLSSDYIKNDYWARLSVSSVQYGAGVINLFFQEAEKAKNNPDFAKKSVEEKKSLFAQIGSAISGMSSSVGNFFSGIFGDDKKYSQQAVENNANQIVAMPLVSSDNQNPQNSSQNLQLNNTGEINQISISNSAAVPDGLALANSSSVNQSNIRQTLLSELQSQLNEISNKANNLNQQIQSLAAQSLNANSSPVVFVVGGGGGNPVILSASENNIAPENQQSDNQQQISQDIQDVQQNSTSTDQNASSTTTSTIIISSADHLVISEIQISGGKADDEFIEIYNPANEIISLDDYSIQYLSGLATSTKKIGNTKKNFKNNTQISPYGFYLLAQNDGIFASQADMTYSFSLSGYTSGASVFLVKSNGSISDLDDPNIVDYVSYGEVGLANVSTSTMPLTNQSLERKAWQDNQCATASSSGEFTGNGCDTNNAADFEIRQTPNPQNSLSLPEPRKAPTAPQNFSIQYSSSTSELIFNWLESQDYSGATSTLTYKIKEINNSSSSLPFIETTSTSAAVAISELGRNYEFEIQSFDKDNLGSASSSANIYVDAPQIIPTQILLSQLDESSGSVGGAWIYQEFGNEISGKLQSLEFKINTNSACLWFSFQEFNDADYNQLSREFKGLESDDATPYFVIKKEDGSLFNYGECVEYGGKIILEFIGDIELNPEKYYRLYLEAGDASWYALFLGSASDAGFGQFRECAMVNDVSQNGWVYRRQDCQTRDFDIYFVLKGIKNEEVLPEEQ